MLPMHIITLEKDPSKQRGGQELCHFEICQGLARRGHTITLLYAKPSNLLEAYQSFGTQILHVPAFTRNIPGYDRRTTLWYHVIKDVLRVLPLARSQTQTVFYCNQIGDTPFLAALSYLTHYPFVCHLHLPSPLKVDLATKIAYHRVNHFITVSHYTRQQWLEFGISPEDITCIHNGIDCHLFNPTCDRNAIRQQWNIPADAKLLAYVGRLDQAKGIEVLLKAFAQLSLHHPNVYLVCAGKPLLQSSDYQVNLQQQLANLNLIDSVKFLGHLDDPSPLYQASDLTIVPSVWPEPFGRVIIESMACGTPVVASRVGGIPEILTGPFAAGLCQADNPEDLAAKILELMSWKEERQQLSQQCHEHIANHFSHNLMIDGVENILLRRLKA